MQPLHKSADAFRAELITGGFFYDRHSPFTGNASAIGPVAAIAWNVACMHRERPLCMDKSPVSIVLITRGSKEQFVDIATAYSKLASMAAWAADPCCESGGGGNQSLALIALDSGCMKKNRMYARYHRTCL